MPVKIKPAGGGGSCVKQEENDLIEGTTQMNRMDRWLVNKYTPFIRKRAFGILLVTVVLAIILGIFGILKFTMSDGKIVLFTQKYNLGRLDVVTDTYFNKDISKTIEENNVTATAAPSSASLYGSTQGTHGALEIHRVHLAFLCRRAQAKVETLHPWEEIVGVVPTAAPEISFKLSRQLDLHRQSPPDLLALQDQGVAWRLVPQQGREERLHYLLQLNNLTQMMVLRVSPLLPSLLDPIRDWIYGEETLSL